MKIKNLILNGLIVILISGIVYLALQKFVLKNKSGKICDITSIDSIRITDIDGRSELLSGLLAKDTETYLYIFELSNCYSCISQGLMDMENLKKAGFKCISLVVHHRVDEIKGWSSTQTFSPFYVMKKEDFYRYIKTPYLPVVLKIKEKKVENSRFITP